MKRFLIQSLIASAIILPAIGCDTGDKVKSEDTTMKTKSDGTVEKKTEKTTVDDNGKETKTMEKKTVAPTP